MKCENRQGFRKHRVRPPLPLCGRDDFDPSSVPPGCVAIPLTNGGYTLIDEEDECRVDEYKWLKTYNDYNWYAVRVEWEDGKRRSVYMHRHLFGLGRGDRTEVDHRNHNGLDNRRSENLRLASPVQNMANCRKLRKVSSKYRGVCRIDRKHKCYTKKWFAEISWCRNGTRKKFSLGYFETEVEAAYAIQVAAPLLKDPEFLRLEEIPAGDLPDPDRLEKISRDTIARVKAALAGTKGKPDATCSYFGVSYDRFAGTWRPIANGRRLGSYGTPQEAAYAFDCAVRILGLTGRRTNGIAEEEIGGPGRADEIRAKVSLRLDASKAGRKSNPKASSRYRGVSRERTLADGSESWAAKITANRRRYPLGTYKSEIEAAIAFKLAISILGISSFRSQVIPEEGMLPPETIERIRLEVERRCNDVKSKANHRYSTDD